MDSIHEELLFLQRSKSELDLAKAIFAISNRAKLKLELELKEDETFYSNVISVSYYSIFYSAKAYLLRNGIKTKTPEEHKKTYEEFEKLVFSGKLDFSLFQIYREMAVRAGELLGIFKREKSKRGQFTYQKLPQANREPASESIRNATTFLNNITLLLQKK